MTVKCVHEIPPLTEAIKSSGSRAVGYFPSQWNLYSQVTRPRTWKSRTFMFLLQKGSCILPGADHQNQRLSPEIRVVWSPYCGGKPTKAKQVISCGGDSSQQHHVLKKPIPVYTQHTVHTYETNTLYFKSNNKSLLCNRRSICTCPF